MRKRRSWKLRLAAALVAFVAALVVVKLSRGSVFAEIHLVRALIPSLNWWWLLPCGPIFLGIALLRAYQVHLVFRSVSKAHFHSVFVGKAYADLAGRFLTKYGGYVLLVDFVARRERLQRSTLFGPLSVYAPLEAANVLVVTVVATQFVVVSEAMAARLRFMWLVIGLLALCCVLSVVISRRAVEYVPAGFGRIPFVGERLEHLTRRWLISFTNGLRAFGRQAVQHPGQVAIIVVSSTVATLFTVLNLYVIGRAAGIHLSFIDFLVVAQLATISSATVTTPGPVGVGELVRASLLFGFGVAYWRAISFVVFAELLWVGCLALLNVCVFWTSHVWPLLVRVAARSIGRGRPILEPVASVPKDPPLT